MRRNRAFSGPLIVVAIVLGMCSAASGASAALQTAGSLSLSRTKLMAGEAFTARGSVPPDARRPVVLQRRVSGSWRIIDRGFTTREGRFRFRPHAPSKVGTRSTYRVRAPATSIGARSYPAVVTPTGTIVVVPQTGTLTADRTDATVGDLVHLRAEFSPVRVGRAVALQGLRDGQWTQVDLGAERANGSVNFTVDAATEGGYYYRAVAQPRDGAAAKRTGTVYLLVSRPPLTITTESLPEATAYQDYVATVETSDHREGTWTATNLDFPWQLSSPDGRSAVISGNTRTSGQETFDLRFCGGPECVTRSFTIIINAAAAPAISTQSLPDAWLREPYSARIETEDGRPGTWKLGGGALPDGLTFENHGTFGLVTGTPTGTSDRTFLVAFEDYSSRVEREFTIAMRARPTQITGELTDGTVGVYYSQPLQLEDPRPGTWKVVDAPSGLELGQQYERPALTGVPAGPPGSYTVTLQYDDVYDNTTTRTMDLVLGSDDDADPAGEWATISSGNDQTCGIRKDSSLHCWGVGPGQYPGEWSTVSVGRTEACGIRVDQTAWCWDADTTSDEPAGLPRALTAVDHAKDWSSVSAGTGLACGIRTDDSLWCWGANGYGQLGNGTTESSSRPTAVDSTTGWRSVSTGLWHTCGVRLDGTVWCWGANDSGQLGTGDTSQELLPQQVGAATDWTSVDAGAFHSCGVREDGSGWCWGQDLRGQLGRGPGGDESSPVQVLGSGWETIRTGDDFTCGLRADRTLWCWGSSSDGQLGVGPYDRASDKPWRSGPYVGWRAVDTGGAHACGLRPSGSAWCWGDNANRQVTSASPNDQTRAVLAP